jgi:4-hydroxy-tetrahydrodipicolinate synthase
VNAGDEWVSSPSPPLNALNRPLSDFSLMPVLRLSGGLWSATPTPFTADGALDCTSVERLVEHHVRLGVSGLFLAGTCGEGPWMREVDRDGLVRTAVAAADRRLTIAVQVTDNSIPRVLDRITQAAAAGADLGVLDAPDRLLNATPQRLVAHYVEVARRSPLPIGFYDRGRHTPFALPLPQLAEVLAEPNVVLVKDSSADPARRDAFLAARAQRPGLLLLNGNEFDCVSYLEAGYDGLLLGGGIFNAAMAQRLLAAVRTGDAAEAGRQQARMNDLMWRVYGGRDIACWLTGLKELLVQTGLFTSRYSLLEYPLSDACRSQIEAMVTGADGMGWADDVRARA